VPSHPCAEAYFQDLGYTLTMVGLGFGDAGLEVVEDLAGLPQMMNT
jgi:hypothetical protein